MTASSVAFFRNLNLGQRRSPSRADLLAAFAAEGVIDALSHQVNGTVAFTPPDGRAAQEVADAVVDRLEPVSEWSDVVLVRSVEWLESLDVDELPDGCELTLMDGPEPFPEVVPWDPGRGEATVLRADGCHAIVLNHRERRSSGTPVIERRLGVPATSRGIGTVQRLLVRLGSA